MTGLSVVSCLRSGAPVLFLSVASLLGGCASTWTAGRSVAADVLHCPEDRLDVLVPHSYNLGVGDHAYRGCGQSIVIRCVTTATETLCRPLSAATPDH